MYESIKYEVDDLIIGRKNKITCENFYGKEHFDANQAQAIACLKYIIEDVLEWSVDTAIKKFDNYMIDKLNIKPMLSYIYYPDEVEPFDALYILSLVYPRHIHLNEEDIIKNTFLKVMSGERKQFPRDYFSGSEGFRRFCFCIKFIIEDNLSLNTIEEIYEFFLNPSKEKSSLISYRLKVPIYHYKIDMFKVIYTITKDYEDAELWYGLYTFKKEMSKIKK